MVTPLNDNASHRQPLNTFAPPSKGPIFTPVQKDWLKDHIPQYMQWPPTSDETITFVQTMLIDFDHMWPLHQKLWPGSNVHILLTDSMHAKLRRDADSSREYQGPHAVDNATDPPFPKSKEVIPSSISWTSDPAGLWSINSERDTMVSVRLDGLINLLQCLSLDDQKTLSQALDIGTDTGTDGDTSNASAMLQITQPQMGLALPLSAPKAWLLFPLGSDDPPATKTLTVPGKLPIDATPPLYYVTRGRYIGIFSGWDATGPKVLGVSRAIYHKVDSIEQGINIVKGAIDRGDASQAL
ncbi:hypothetical protein DEU56DRAFT_762469 [Suillus clintonianus]|uniref:uncharacterized protein n=1 Tax=Suillus clintonianus TaxID=1904413 RepID=UPI001B866685|nr:uncharacterized protein DEU56DRAFT_762469 [Suillus clintonianus]KAG2109147.1 hypothetical protein DEU56DRAFT_762469 [Suillus clintonianus]